MVNQNMSLKGFLSMEDRAQRIGRVVFAAIAALLAAAAFVSCGGGSEEQTPYRVGVMESLTGPGEAYGNVANHAKQMALDEINAAGGIEGRPLEFVIQDSMCSAQGAIAAYKKLTSADGVKIILGPSCSGAMLGAAPLAEADGTILFSGLASNADIAHAGDFIFRTQINDAEVGFLTGNLLWLDGVRNLATITELTDYAEGIRLRTVAQFEKNGGTIIAEERYGADVTDFRTQISKLLAAEPDALHIAPQSEFSAGTIIKQARELGYEGPIYAEEVTLGATSLQIAGEAANGVKAIAAEIRPDNRRGQEVLANFRARYNYLSLPWHLSSAYDDVYITAECLRQTGDDQDAEGFRDCLYEMTFTGAIGEDYSFDENGEVVGISRNVVQVLPFAERTPENRFVVLDVPGVNDP